MALKPEPNSRRAAFAALVDNEPGVLHRVVEIGRAHV